jgi:ankyrin repeat protein
MKLLASRKQPKFDMSKTIADACGSSHFPAVEDFKFYNYASIHWQKHIFYVSGDHGSVCKLAAKAIQSRTPTFKASHTSLTECRWAAEHGNIKGVELLFQAARTARTPLLSAIAFEREDVVEALLNAGVDVNERDGNNTPLKEAMRHYKRGSRIEITRLLLRTGKVDIKAADDEEEPLITIAAKRGDREIVELLLKSKNINVNVQDYTGRTALIGAALNSNIDLVKLLLDVGKADPNLQDSYGETALTWAAFHGSRNLVELLLASGSDPNLKNRKGQTALMQATAFRKDQVFELLTNNKNVGRNAKDTIGQTAQVLAKPEKHTEIMELREPRTSPSTNKGTMDRWKGVNVGTLQPLDRSFGYAQW